MHSIEHARIHYNEQGTPVSDAFGDVYFSNESGLEETHYVFLQQNGLPLRWALHQKAAFHVIETGFGTGLNFLLCWQAFQQYRLEHPTKSCQRLYFSTFEKYPLTRQDLEKALAAWPSLQSLACELLSQYPPASSGCHRLQFDEGRVTLDLWLGDVQDNLPALSDSNIADAWFLDGFAPSKNPQMWQDFLFLGMARLSKPGTTVATFTAAGIVRRGLQSAGFTIEKIKGFGKKREMVKGTILDSFEQPERTASASTILAKTAQQVTIVGGGLSAIMLALACVAKGMQVQLLCADGAIAQGASHNRQGALYPQFETSMSGVTQFHLQAFTFATSKYRQLQQYFSFPGQSCGVLLLACNARLQDRMAKMQRQHQLPSTIQQFVSATQASDIAGVTLPFDALYFPQGGWLAPQRLCQAALNYLITLPLFSVRFDCRVEQFASTAHGWLLQTSQGEVQANQLALCVGAQLTNWPQTEHLPVNRIRGQVSHIKNAGLTALKTVLCHQGYITPTDSEFIDEACIGATFDRTRATPEILPEDDDANLALVQQVFGTPDWFDTPTVISAKAGVRATVKDHLPLAGELAPRLFVLGGLGARGLLYAPILAEQLSSRLANEPSPLPAGLAALVDVRRFNPSA